MIIDFHTHAFNEKIVEKALASLTANSGLCPMAMAPYKVW